MTLGAPLVFVAGWVTPPSTGDALTTYESKYYLLETDLPTERAKFIGRVMDATGLEYNRRFQGFRGIVRNKPRLRVYAARERYLEALRLTSDGATLFFTRGVFAPWDETVYTYDGEDGELQRVLKHECFHQFAHRVIGGRLPPWVNEGLAEYFEEGEFDEATGRLRLGAAPEWRVRLLRQARDENRLLTVEELLHLDPSEWNDNMADRRGAVQYCQAWALCHLMAHADDGKYRRYFEKYLHELDRGLDADTAFNRSFGPNLKPLQIRYDAYLQRLVPSKNAPQDPSPPRRGG